jgi:hypothetical protein
MELTDEKIAESLIQIREALDAPLSAPARLFLVGMIIASLNITEEDKFLAKSVAKEMGQPV